MRRLGHERFAVVGHDAARASRTDGGETRRGGDPDTVLASRHLAM